MENWKSEILKAGELYKVGGAVRDELIDPNVKPKDIDFLVTGIPIRKLKDILKKYGTVNKVGKSFGVLIFNPQGSDDVYDIALPRKEYSAGAGYQDFTVKYDYRLNVEIDLSRRDFTINAIAYDIRTGKYVSPFSGLEDIEEKLIRVLNEKSFIDDPLRMLRAIQLAIRLKFEIEKDTLGLIKKNSQLIENISPERIAGELNKILTQSDKPSIGFEIMYRTGLLSRLLPELTAGAGIEQNDYHIYDIMRHSFLTCDAAPKDNLIVRWASLLHDIGKVKVRRIIGNKEQDQKVVFYGHEHESSRMAKDILGRLHLSNNIIDNVAHLIDCHMFDYELEWTDSAVRRFIKNIGPEHIDNLFLLRQADRIAAGKTRMSPEVDEFKIRIVKELEEKTALNISDLKVSGKDVMKLLDIPQSPEVGKVMNYLLELVLEDPDMNNRKNLIECIRNYKETREPVIK